MEIRSEVSAPARLRPRWLGGGYLVSSLLVLGSGGRRGYGRRHFFRRRSWVTAGSARTRQGTLGSLEPPFAAASSDDGRFFPQGRRKPRPARRSAVGYEQPHTRNAPQRTSRHHGGAARVAHCASAVGCGHCPPASATACKLSLRSLKFPQRRSCQTKPSLMEGSSTMMKWPTSRMVS